MQMIELQKEFTQLWLKSDQEAALLSNISSIAKVKPHILGAMRLFPCYVYEDSKPFGSVVYFKLYSLWTVWSEQHAQYI